MTLTCLKQKKKKKKTITVKFSGYVIGGVWCCKLTSGFQFNLAFLFILMAKMAVFYKSVTLMAVTKINTCIRVYSIVINFPTVWQM